MHRRANDLVHWQASREAIRSAKAEPHRAEKLRSCWSYWDRIRFFVVSWCRNACQGTGAVLRLSESLRDGHRLFTDRFFTTLPLISALLERSVYLTGTISKRNVPKPVLFTSDKLLSKQGRGSSEQFVSENDIAIVKRHRHMLPLV